jgi:hypothetical protein
LTEFFYNIFSIFFESNELEVLGEKKLSDMLFLK